MIAGQIPLLIAMAAFVGSHWLLSHPLREPMIEQFGTEGFRTVYSVVAAATLVLVRYHSAPHDQPPIELAQFPAMQVIYSVMTLVAIALFIASLVDNPALAGYDMSGLSTRIPTGVYRITRHPMMFAVALFCLAHLLIYPTVRNSVFCGGFIVLAIVGAAQQDRKNARRNGREWNPWVTRTRFWPNVARLHALTWVWGAAVVPWLGLTWLLGHLTQLPVGIWWFFGVS